MQEEEERKREAEQRIGWLLLLLLLLFVVAFDVVLDEERNTTAGHRFDWSSFSVLSSALKDIFVFVVFVVVVLFLGGDILFFIQRKNGVSWRRQEDKRRDC